VDLLNIWLSLVERVVVVVLELAVAVQVDI